MPLLIHLFFLLLEILIRRGKLGVLRELPDREVEVGVLQVLYLLLYLVPVLISYYLILIAYIGA